MSHHSISNQNTPTSNKNSQNSRAIVRLLIGNTSKLLKNKNHGEENFTHKWTIYVRASGPEQFTDRSLIRKVIFQLHPTFTKPEREVKKPPFELTEYGYGSFDMKIYIYFNNISKSFKIDYNLDLHISQDSENETLYQIQVENPPPEFASLLQKYCRMKQNPNLEQKCIYENAEPGCSSSSPNEIKAKKSSHKRKASKERHKEEKRMKHMEEKEKEDNEEKTRHDKKMKKKEKEKQHQTKNEESSAKNEDKGKKREKEKEHSTKNEKNHDKKKTEEHSSAKIEKKREESGKKNDAIDVPDKGVKKDEKKKQASFVKKEVPSTDCESDFAISELFEPSPSPPTKGKTPKSTSVVSNSPSSTDRLPKKSEAADNIFAKLTPPNTEGKSLKEKKKKEKKDAETGEEGSSTKKRKGKHQEAEEIVPHDRKPDKTSIHQEEIKIKPKTPLPGLNGPESSDDNGDNSSTTRANRIIRIRRILDLLQADPEQYEDLLLNCCELLLLTEDGETATLNMETRSVDLDFEKINEQTMEALEKLLTNFP